MCKNFLKFDTSSIPDNAIIRDANLSSYITSAYSEDNLILTSDYYSWESLEENDFFADFGNIAFSKNISQLSVNNYNSFPLSNTNFINKTGYTGFRLEINSLASQGLYNTVYYQTPILEVNYYVNSLPNINTPSQIGTLSDADTGHVFQISVSDVDNDALTCKYYIDSEPTARDTKPATNTATVQTVSFSPININALTEGNHTIVYEVSDGTASPVTYSVTFKVDKSAPNLGTVTASSAIDSITVSGSATDSIAGMASYPYRYTIGSIPTSWTTSASYTKDSLTPNTPYPVAFEARDSAGHITSSTFSIYTRAVLPSLAVGNAASYTFDVSIIGSAISNPDTTQYVISLKDEQNIIQYVTPEGTLTSSPVWTALTDKKITARGLKPNMIYSVQAKARNGGNIETDYCTAVSGRTLMKPPAAPGKPTAARTSTQITVFWDEIADATDGYDIQADNRVIHVGTSHIYVHTGLSPNTPHTYMVRANNNSGPGDWSEQLVIPTLPSNPDVPVNLNAVAQSTSITVTWSNVASATGYDIEVDGALNAIGPNTSYTHSSLTPGTYHSYRVRSINEGGKSAWSTSVSAITTQVSSPVPTNLTAAPSQNEINLVWNAVGGATGYDIQVDSVAIDNGTNTSYTHKNLAAGSQHMYRVRSKKNGIISDWSAAVVSTALSDAFGTPSNFMVKANDTSITLTWNKVSGASSYEVEADGTAIDNGTGTSAIISGLDPGSSHTYRVRAADGTNASDWSQLIEVSTYALPTPVILSAASAETAISLEWNTTTTASLTYELEADGSIISNIDGTSYTCTGYMPNTQHTFRVRAINQSGTSNWSIPMTKSTIFSGVNVPSGLFAIMRNTSATIAWQPMNGAISYDISADGTVINITGTKYIHTGLQPGSQHTYKVRAVNDTGTGDWSPAITVTAIMEGPAVPSNIITSSTTSKVLVTWDKVTGADEYEIDVDGVVIANGAGTSYLQSSLAPSTSHKYRVRAKSAAGYSAWSDYITETTKSSTKTYAVDCTANEELSLVFSATNIQDLGQYTFTVTYNPDELEVIDLCGSTSRIDDTIGNIIGTDVQIMQFEPGTIVLKKNGSAQGYEVWSGVVNTVKFKYKLNVDGQANVIYSFQ
jgi:hypothetical protein